MRGAVIERVEVVVNRLHLWSLQNGEAQPVKDVFQLAQGLSENVQPANRLGSIVSIGLSSVLVSTILRHVNADILGVHIGRLDAVFMVGALITILSGVYFGVAARRPVPPDLMPATAAAPAPSVAAG